MTSYERTKKFINAEPVDHPPFMPLLIQMVPGFHGVTFFDTITDPEIRADAFLHVTKHFGLDSLTSAADFYEQLEAFGQQTEYTAEGPRTHPFLTTLDGIEDLTPPEIKPGLRIHQMLESVRILAEKSKGEYCLFASLIGPFTEYCNARDVKKAMHDMKKDKERMLKGLDLFFRNDMQLMKAELDAGANAIIIIEPNCSLVSPTFYAEYIQPLHKQIIEYAHSRGAITRLHICGDTLRHVPYTLGTGVDILDIDSSVDVAEAATHLGPHQCLCGNLNTTEELLFGKPENFPAAVQKRVEAAKGRIILAGGCEIPPATSYENILAFHDAVASLSK